MSEAPEAIMVRDATEADLPALALLRPPLALHRDRLEEARGGDLRYLTLLRQQTVLGFACLVFRRPRHWSDADDTRHLPQVVDLWVAPSWRGQGYGSAFLGAIEQQAARGGCEELYLAVEPESNARVFRLYTRLGYRALQLEPHRSMWEFTDSDGNRHQGEDWTVDMVKRLGNLHGVIPGGKE